MKRYEVSGFGVMEYEEVASTNSLAEKLPLSELKDKQVIFEPGDRHRGVGRLRIGGRVPRERIFQ